MLSCLCFAATGSWRKNKASPFSTVTLGWEGRGRQVVSFMKAKDSLSPPHLPLAYELSSLRSRKRGLSWIIPKRGRELVALRCSVEVAQLGGKWFSQPGSR